MGNTHSSVRSRKGSSTKSSKNVNVVHNDTFSTTISTKTTETSLSTPPIKPIRTSYPTNEESCCKSSHANVHPNGITSLPPSPTQSDDPANMKEVKLVEAIIINGRKYQNFNTKYILPSDDQEQDRLVQVHFIYKYIFGGNFSAPVRDLLSGSCEKSKRHSAEWSTQEELSPKVLDIACGNGTWIMDMATEFPNTQFYGVDFAANYPTTIKPSNTFFLQHDVLSPKGLPFPNDHFDYVHMRQVYTCFSESDWNAIVKEIKRVLKPGGYVECRDIDPMLKNMGPATEKLFKNYPLLMKENHGVDVFWAKVMHEYLQNVGEMTDMHRQMFALPFGTKAGPIGDMIHTSLRFGLESYRLFFLKASKQTMTDAEYDQIIDDIVNESIERHSCFNYYCCWGRKPLFDHYENIPNKDSPIITNTISPLDTPNRTGENLPSSSNATLLVASSIPTTDQDFSEKKYFMSTYTWDSRNKEDFPSLGSENVSDIDQFVEGYED